jgi:transposase
MSRYEQHETEDNGVFVGIDVHLKSWHVTIMTVDEELFSGSVPAGWTALEKLLGRYCSRRVRAVYEAGYFGFWLHDLLVASGVECVVTPPSLLPMEYGNRVKTDRRDSRKLAHLLSKGMLKRVWVPSLEERYDRQVIRRRHQLLGDRVRVQNRIKAELRFSGIALPASRGSWSTAFFESLKQVQFDHRWMQESFQRLLDEYAYLDEQVRKQTHLLKELSETKTYRDRVALLSTIPGVGILSAMEILLELGDMTRFRRAGQLAAYVGLTPSQYSSGEKVRLGRITGTGKNNLRGMMVEIAWQVVMRNSHMRATYEKLKSRSGSKRAIVAVARRVLLCARRLLLDGASFRAIVEA